MKIENLQKTIVAFLEDPHSRSLMIDGKWGCGKTFQIRKFIDEHKKKIKIENSSESNQEPNDGVKPKKINKKSKKYKKIPIYYISLFGLKSIDDIDKKLYSRINALKRFGIWVLKILKSLVITASSNHTSIAVELGNQLNLVKEKAKVKRKMCIIFDDIERLGENVGYIELFGYLNNLLRGDTKFICICDAEQIGLINQNDEQRVKDYNRFREKIFDTIIHINEQPYDIIKSLCDENNIKDYEELLPLFDNNLRNVNKTLVAYNRISCELDNRKLDYDAHDLLVACICTIKIIFGTFEEVQFAEDDMSRYSFDYYVDMFNKDIANAIYSLKKLPEFKEFLEGNNYLKATLKAYYYNDYSSFDETLGKKENKNKASNINLFLLSDDENREHSEWLIETINNHQFDKITNVIQSFINLCNYTIIDITDDKLDKMCQSIVDCKNVITGNIEDIEFCIETGDHTNYLDKASTLILEKMNIKKSNDLIEKLNDAVEASDFDTIIDIFEKNHYKEDFKNSNKALGLIRGHNYLLPNFKNTIENYTWHYCHSICDFLVKMGFKDELFDYFVKEAKENRNNITYVKKIKALCKYRLNKVDELNQNINLD